MHKRYNIFLSGACRGVSIAERNSWRQYFEDVEKTDWNNKYNFFNPNKKFAYEDDGVASEKVIMDYFLNRLDNCDIVVINLSYSNGSTGTGMECMRAVDKNKYIIGFNATENVYEYVKDCCNVVLDTKEDVWEFITTYFD